MSTRTIVEINHDYLQDLCERPNYLAQFIYMLGRDTARAKELMPLGIRFIGQRHHSETLKLEIK